PAQSGRVPALGTPHSALGARPPAPVQPGRVPSLGTRHAALGARPPAPAQPRRVPAPGPRPLAPAHSRCVPALGTPHSALPLIPLNPVLTAMRTYPYLKLEEAKREAAARGVRILDFGVGDPREKTDGRIRQALVDGLTEVSSYPAAAGLPALREAIAAWYERRFGLRLDPQRGIVPTLGSKEAIFLMA